MVADLFWTCRTLCHQLPTPPVACPMIMSTSSSTVESVSPSTDPPATNGHWSPVVITAEKRIPAQASSKAFYFDVYRLMSILYGQNQQQSEQMTSLKITTLDGQLHCPADPLGWTYQVRLAANCFEQNLIAELVSVLEPLSATPPDQRQQQLQRIVLRTTRPILPGEELSFWPSFDLSLALDIPFLTPANIISGTCYLCTACGKIYSQPNPLKIHLRFACPVRNASEVTPPPSSSSAAGALLRSGQYLFGGKVIAGHSIETSRLCRLTNGGQVSSLVPHLAAAIGHHHHHHSTKQTKKLLSGGNAKGIKRSLNGHRKLHSCSYCGKVYTRKYGLKIHIRTHTGLKPLHCRFCGRSFSDPSNLNKHVRLHTQQGPPSIKSLLC